MQSLLSTQTGKVRGTQELMLFDDNYNLTLYKFRPMTTLNHVFNEILI